jgi:hypothetical protein
MAGRGDGRFSNDFRVRGELICHRRIHVDPEFAGDDAARFFCRRSRGRPPADRSFPSA